MNLFDQLANQATDSAPKAKKSDKIIVDVPGADFDHNMRKFAELDSKIKEQEAELAMYKAAVLAEGKERFANLYGSMKRNPGSFILRSNTGANCMFLPTDKYLKITKDQFDELSGEYGADAVEQESEFGFSKAMLEKYANVISEFIMKSDAIEDADRGKIITVKNNYSVKKGAIDCAFTTGKGQVDQYLDDIQYVAQMKSPKLPA